MKTNYHYNVRLHIGGLYLQTVTIDDNPALAGLNPRHLGGRFMEFGHIYRLDLDKVYPTIDQPVLARLDILSGADRKAVFETLASGPNVNIRFHLGAADFERLTWEEINVPEDLPCYVHYPEKTVLFDMLLMGVPA